MHKQQPDLGFFSHQERWTAKPENIKYVYYRILKKKNPDGNSVEYEPQIHAQNFCPYKNEHYVTNTIRYK